MVDQKVTETSGKFWQTDDADRTQKHEKVQRRFTKRLKGLSELSYDDRLKLLNLERLEIRRLRFDLLCCYKIIKCKKLIRLQHRVRAMKSHIQNSTNHFFWDNVIARSHIALTIHLT